MVIEVGVMALSGVATYFSFINFSKWTSLTYSVKSGTGAANAVQELPPELASSTNQSA